MLNLTNYQLERIREAYRLIDTVTDELEYQREDRNDMSELHAAWISLDNFLESI